MKRGIIIGVCALSLASCGGGDSTSDSEAEPSSETSRATATATVTETETAAPECDPPSVQSANLLAFSWSLVVASRGAPDHQELAESFFDSASEFSEDFEDGGCTGEPADSASYLAYAASLVNAQSLIGGADVTAYRDVVETGNQLLALMESDNQFIPVSCTGKVDQTLECTAL
jgi:hypothetical protein